MNKVFLPHLFTKILILFSLSMLVFSVHARRQGVRAGGVETANRARANGGRVVTPPKRSQDALRGFELLPQQIRTEAPKANNIRLAELANEMSNHPRIQDQLTALSKKLESDPTVDTVAIKEIITLAESVRSFRRNNRQETATENVLLDLLTHSNEIVTSWPASNRNSIIGLFTLYNQGKAEGKDTMSAFNSALTQRGYDSVSKRRNRTTEIFRNCRL